jgi:uncharacterized protein (DUF2252 family)
MPKIEAPDTRAITQVAGPTTTSVQAPGKSQRSIAERRAMGVAARQRAPRTAHATWSPAPDRPDPIALLQSQDRTRVPELVPIRYGRMLASPFAFLRGSAIVMAHDLAHTPTAGIITQLCGDAHLANFGLFGTPERALLFDVNDFDETLPGPWEWDVKRLTASIVVAGRENGFAAASSVAAASAAVRAYREQMSALAGMRDLEVWYARLDADAVAATLTNAAMRKTAERAITKARRTDQLRALAKMTVVVDGVHRIVEDPPLVTRLEGASEHERIEQLFHAYRESLRDDYRVLLDRYRIVDAARKVVGVGSVGTRCFIGLLVGRDADDPLFLQVKEAGPSVLAAHLPKSRYRNNGQRVVVGQRLMQAASDLCLGWVRAADGRDYYWRQLRDMKGSLEIATMTSAGFGKYAQLCAVALAYAHARSGDPIAIASYLGTSDRFESAIAAFAVTYADQTERDHALLVEAVRSGRIAAESAPGTPQREAVSAGKRA